MATRAGSDPTAGTGGVPLRSRLFGLGSVYGKALRDSRRALVFAVLLLAGLIFYLCAALPSVILSTQAGRDDMARIAADLAASAQGTSGKPVNVGTIGGYTAWKYGPVFLVIASLWSILALSGTLAAEARNGSLEFVAGSPLARRRIALEKLAAHVTGIAAVLAVMAATAWLAAAVFGKIPGDAIPPQAALAYVVCLGLSALSFGALAFALAQFFGRSAGAGIAGTALLGGWLLNGYGSLWLPFAALGDLTPWAWTADNIPLAGQYDWAWVAPVVAVVAVLLALGVEGFARRDVGATSSIWMPSLPAVSLGLRGPASRALGERLPFALAWGFGIGTFGLALAAISRFLADQFAESPDVQNALRSIFPATDVGSAPGFLQLLIQLMYVVAGLAAATLIAGWASDEGSGRLEMMLSAPLGRSRWALLSGLGTYAAVGLVAVMAAAGVGIGALLGDMDPWTPAAGTLSLGLIAAAAAGVGFAVGGFRSSVAAEIVVLVVVVEYLIDLLAPALKLPDWIHQLALTAHLGQPVAGSWDWAGVIACLAIAAGGLLLGAWGMRRRDID
jgi:ABC-2 type transport system permease protein